MDSRQVQQIAFGDFDEETNFSARIINQWKSLGHSVETDQKRDLEQLQAFVLQRNIHSTEKKKYVKTHRNIIKKELITRGPSVLSQYCKNNRANNFQKRRPQMQTIKVSTRKYAEHVNIIPAYCLSCSSWHSFVYNSVILNNLPELL